MRKESESQQSTVLAAGRDMVLNGAGELVCEELLQLGIWDQDWRLM